MTDAPHPLPSSSMTDDKALAEQVVREWWCNDGDVDGGFPITDAYQDLAERITHALAQARRETWEQAIKAGEMEAYSMTGANGDVQLGMRLILEALRSQQSQEQP